MSPSKKHHFIPACYLAGFTEGGKRDSSFWSMRTDGTKNPYETNPNNSCVINNYYKLDSDYPLLVEEWYAKTIESKIADTLRDIEKNRRLPKPADMEFVYLLVATLRVRNPVVRKINSDSTRKVGEVVLDALLGDPKLLEQCARKAFENECIPKMPSKLDIVEMCSLSGRMNGAKKAFAGNNKSTSSGDLNANSIAHESSYAVSPSANLLVLMEIGILENFVITLSRRQWILFVIPEDSDHEFITSDNPFSLYLPNKSQKTFFGIATKGTEIVVPVNRKSALLGVFSKEDNCTVVATTTVVNLINRYVAANSSFLFSSKKKILGNIC